MHFFEDFCQTVLAVFVAYRYKITQAMTPIEMEIPRCTSTKMSAKTSWLKPPALALPKETVGEWLNLARRYERLNNFLEAANCARKAIQIHEVWGSRLNSYSMNEATLQRAKSIVAKGA